MTADIPATTFATEYEFNDPKKTPLIIRQDSNGDLAAGVGSTIWDASYVLSKYIEKAVGTDSTQAEESNFLRKPSQRVRSAVSCLELGSGTGLVGLVSGAVLQHLRQLYLSDKSSVMPLLKHNVGANQFREDLDVIAVTLDWTNLEEAPEELTEKSIDLIVCSDCLWEENLHQPLLDAFVKYSNPRTMVLLAFESRKFEEEARFFAKFGELFQFRDIKPEEQDERWQSEDIYIFVAKRR
ncbi:hypothetical protein K493DRAFT_321557 [Basidiobolus meristosporus CBS 931.73]|uniref:S-adenosyl-L-methionine-dependent methyltransferase n=1 Tax=Basidiobolus meristosporus CBS 931.73 TaxID=1314790 RepID=A0A1Y1WSA9_9FUNG|nr:hypothetical protein K493DRAFT_321557 [Basidiobolus meristosporus CBS 931.73]|eukprot:ORX76431.1 hypothetical protein K493DRAFT_321557 [Basidiobolus meristosporus CBS 931.73]